MAAPRSGPRRTPLRDTREDIFLAAADLFSARGFDGVGVEDIAHAARLNKAMIYYHFEDKLALYREVVRDMLRSVGTMAAEIAGRPEAADARLSAFIAGMVALADQRPWFPPLMLREIAEGAPRLDPETLALMKTVFLAFHRILTDGQADAVFRPVHPVLAYMSILGPLLVNAARERAAARPGRVDLPMFVEVPHPELIAHMQQAALRLLAPEPTRS
jgi:TetR/AcrR family transcriptional regulator